jgi:predicted enzyme related to lactoylglutathione lyase
MKNAIHWFEIPTTDLPRASAFYEAVLGVSLEQEDFGGTPMAIFPADEDGVAGGLVLDPRRSPSSKGALVYLDATGQLDACLARVAGARGEVVLPKTSIGPQGFIALVRDTEGNCVGLHSP